MDITENGILEAHPELHLILAEYRTLELALANQRATERKQAKKDEAAGVDDSADADRDEQPVENGKNRPKQPRFRKKASEDPEVELLERVERVEGVPDEDLSKLHGMLIAWGFLRLEIVSRELTGYQLTNLGKQAAEGRFLIKDSPEVVDQAA